MKRCLVLLTLFCIIDSAYCQADKLGQQINALMKQYESIGLSVAVVKDNKIIYSDSFGYKNIEDSVPLRTDDIFRIASVTKTFVATAIMQLVERGKVHLDDDVNEYLGFLIQNPIYPEVPITIRMLLCHRSSINDSQGYKTFDKINPQTNSQYPKCYNDYEPGSKYVYSNLNYNLLGAIIENVTGKRFDKFIYRKIIRPLRLHGRFNVLDLDSTLFVSAYRYNRNNKTFALSKDTYLPYCEEINSYRLGFSTPYLSAAGGMKITASELAKYMIMHMNEGRIGIKRILKSESERIMRNLPSEKDFYALSITHYKNFLSGEELIGQTGGAHGIHTAMIFHPEKKYGFVVFCNGCNCESANGQELNFNVIRLLYNNLIIN